MADVLPGAVRQNAAVPALGHRPVRMSDHRALASRRPSVAANPLVCGTNALFHGIQQRETRMGHVVNGHPTQD